MIPKPLASVIIVVVTIVWAGNFVASVFSVGYQSDTTLNFVFMAIVGGALALRSDRSGDGGMMGRLISAALTRPQDPSRPSDSSTTPPTPEQERPS